MLLLLPTRLAEAIARISNDTSHPVQIALRTYFLCLSLSLGPALTPFVLALTAHPKSIRVRARSLWRALLRELRPTGFASAVTAAVAGGVALQRLWDLLGRRYPLVHGVNSRQRAFLANVVSSTFGIALLRWKKHQRPGTASPTLDLSILFLVRALDASVQAFLLRTARETTARESDAPLGNDVMLRFDKRSKDLAKDSATRLDALVFWASSARIMWCFFYRPDRLPLSYMKWINSLANVDKRLLEVLRCLREGTWSYVHGPSARRDTVGPLAEELGRSPSWGDPVLLPAYGGDFANKAWKQLGVDGRDGIGGLPCELVHGGIGASFGVHNSCIANAAIRAMYAFVEALAIYVPVHFLPILLAKPMFIMRPHRALHALLLAIRSATFLSAFISSYWFAVCFTRTLVLARLFPNISHDVWDGPYGCTLAGSLVCGASIWIEHARRRGEMALYVLPKALKASIPETWLRSRHPMVQSAECLTFVLSLASLLTLSVHQPESLRGLSRWTLAFIMKGPEPGFWQRRRKDIPAPMHGDLPVDYHRD